MMADQFTLSSESEKFLGSVREHLVIRGLNADQTGAHIEEMAGHLAETGRSATDEYGSPEAYAAAVVGNSGTPEWQRWLIPLGSFVSAILLFMAIEFASLGSDEGVLSGGDVSGLLPLGFVALIGNTVGMAKLRDRVRGVPIDDADGLGRTMLIGGVVFIILAIASFLLSYTLDDLSIGWGSRSGWTMAALCAVGAMVIGWFTIVKPGLRPRFPEGSPLRAGIFTRRIRTKS